MLTDLALAARRLMRTPGYSITVIGMVALGLGATAATFGVVHGVLLRPLPYRNPDTIVRVDHRATRVELTRDGVSLGLVDFYRARSRSLAAMGVYIEQLGTLSDAPHPERVRTVLTTPGLFAVLQPAAALGRTLVPADYEPGGEGRVVLSHSLWTRRYASDPGIVGRNIEIERNLYRVVGVAEAGFHFPHAETEAWIAWGWPPAAATRASLRGLGYSAVARLAPGVAAVDAQRDLNALLRAVPDAFPEVPAGRIEEMGFEARVTRLQDAMVADVRDGLVLLLASAVLLLGLTWANAANITVVRGARLRRDVAVTQALGAPASSIARRFYGEGAVLAAAATTLGLLLAAVLLAVRFGLSPNDLPRLGEVGLNGMVVAVAIVLGVVTALALGMVCHTSALAQQGFALTRSGSRASASRAERRVREALVVGQVALALTLLVGSALMARSFWQLKSTPLGFRSDNVLVFRVPLPPGEYSSYHASARVHHDILTRIRALPGVLEAEAAHASTFPLTPVPSHYQFRLVPAGRPVERDAASSGRLGFATPGYFRAMGIPIVSGREFRPEDSGGAHGVILSRALARSLFGPNDAVGQRIRWAAESPYPDYTVVGVVGDVPGEGVEDGPSRAFYFPHVYPPVAPAITGVIHDYIMFDEMYVVRTAAPPGTAFAAFQEAVRQVDPKLVLVAPSPLSDLVARSRSRVRLTMVLLGSGATTALLLGVIGIYGMLAYTVSLRAPELAIRLALGASPSDLASMVLRRGALQAVAGVSLGLAAAFALSRSFEHRLYQVSSTDPLAYAATAAVLLAATLGASYLAARRTHAIDPSAAMRDS